MQENIDIIKELLQGAKVNGIYAGNKYFHSVEKMLEDYKKLDEDNNDLRRLYRRTAVKLKEKGHEELAGYFLAQINEVPTFVVEDDIDYYSEYHRLLRENQMLRGQLNDAFDRGFIHISTIQKKIDEIKSTSSQINGDYFMMNYKIDVLQEILDERNKNYGA